MPHSPLTIAALAVVATGVGVSRLLLDPEPLAEGPATLAAAGGVLITLVAVTGFLLARGRWSRALGVGMAGVWLGVGAGSELGAIDIALIVVAAASGAAFISPWATGWVRRLPAADGPPQAGLVTLLGLIGSPLVIALSSADRLVRPALGLAAWSVLLAFAIARAMAWGVWVVRLAHPLLGAVAAMTAGLPGGAVIAAWTLATTSVAWHPEVAEAVRPALIGRGDPVPIPPELAPQEVLEAAGLDESGEPLRS